MRTLFRHGFTVACCLWAAAAALAGDWPQILGPQRNGVAADDETLSAAWPESGPAVLWEIPVGQGFAGVAVVGKRAILFDRQKNVERVQVLSTQTGQPVWGDQYPTDFVPQYGRDDGPLCVPTIAGERVVTFGAGGVLSCYELDTGEVLWRHATQDEYRVLEGYFGAGSSPLVEQGKVIVNVGSRSDNAGLVAYDLETGKVAWKAVADGASYSSPIAVTVNSTRHVIALTRLQCVSLNPADGAVQFQFPFGTRGTNVTAACPTVFQNHLFLTASYGIGAALHKIQADAAPEEWSDNNVLSSQYTTCVELDGLLYGIDGRQDIPPADLKCINPVTRKTEWTEAAFGYATLIRAGDSFLLAKTDGELILAKLDAAGFHPLSRARVLQGTVRALPALAGGRLYLRDEGRLKCLEVGRTGDP